MKPMGAPCQSVVSENLASGLSQPQFPCMIVRMPFPFFGLTFLLFLRGQPTGKTGVYNGLHYHLFKVYPCL